MLFFQNLVDETQMPKPQKYTDIFILTKKLFIVGLQGLQNISIPVERPCRSTYLRIFWGEPLLELNKDCIAKSISFGPILTSNYYVLLQGSQMLGRHMCMLVMVHTGKYGRIVRLHGLWSFQPRVTKYKERPVFMDYILTNNYQSSV